MLKRYLIKLYIKFHKKTVVGKILNFIGKIVFGKIAFVTGYDPNGKEFYKTTNTRSLDKLFVTLKETGYTELEEHTDVDGVENALKSLAVQRRRNS